MNSFFLRELIFFLPLHRSRENRDCHANFLVHYIESKHGDRVSSNNIIVTKMRSNFCRVVSQGDVTYIHSTKQEGGQLAKCLIRLKEFGGSKFGNEYVCTMFGNLAQCKFYDGDLVIASLRFQVHEVNGAVYQEVVVNDMVSLNNKYVG